MPRTPVIASKDPLAQNQYQPATIPLELADWLGVGIGFFGYSVPDAPTDANLSIGDTQIVQWVNVSFAVFDLNGNNILFNGQHLCQRRDAVRGPAALRLQQQRRHYRAVGQDCPSLGDVSAPLLGAIL